MARLGWIMLASVQVHVCLFGREDFWDNDALERLVKYQSKFETSIQSLQRGHVCARDGHILLKPSVRGHVGVACDMRQS